MAPRRAAGALLLAAVRAAGACTNYTGYIVDLYCWYWPNHVAEDSAPLATAPQNHTLACALMDECIGGGFGLLVPNGSNTYSLAYTFDANTNSLALTYLAALNNSGATKNVAVSMCGTASGSVLSASNIYDVSGATKIVTSAATMTWRPCLSGFLAAVHGWQMPGHVAMDGTPLATAPQNHTVQDLLNPMCKASGYGLLVAGTGGAYSWGYTFDDMSNGLAVTYLEAIAAAGATKDVMVSVCAAPPDEKLMVYTITDLSGATSTAVSWSTAGWAPMNMMTTATTTMRKLPDTSQASGGRLPASLVFLAWLVWARVA